MTLLNLMSLTDEQLKQEKSQTEVEMRGYACHYPTEWRDAANHLNRVYHEIWRRRDEKI